MEELSLGGRPILPGTRQSIDLPVGNIGSHAPVILPVHVVRGRRSGPTLLVTACLHGDELNGAEIVRRLLRTPAARRIRGTLLAAPILNLPSFLSRSRYLPDRRDLNRCFPGAASGSLGARLAKVVSSELLPPCDAVIDLHTGPINRPNLPQTRVSPDDAESMKLARAFGAPVVSIAPVRAGSFRETCLSMNKPVVLFESGEAARLEAASIRFGLRGITAVMRRMEMLPKSKGRESRKPPPVICRKSSWERAPAFGLFTPLVPLGKAVTEEDALGFVSDPVSGDEFPVHSSREGIVIGRTNDGLVNEGDALFHIATPAAEIDVEGHIAESGEALPSIKDGSDDHPVHHDPFSDV